mmetsp:Transcript_44068/g.99246  ORF Transcript_44068/g.99246 Transcript_44068/m.99246 type:complete len:339 (-) Transcript_44068:1985-3001(-)
MWTLAGPPNNRNPALASITNESPPLKSRRLTTASPSNHKVTWGLSPCLTTSVMRCQHSGITFRLVTTNDESKEPLDGFSFFSILRSGHHFTPQSGASFSSFFGCLACSSAAFFSSSVNSGSSRSDCTTNNPLGANKICAPDPAQCRCSMRVSEITGISALRFSSGKQKCAVKQYSSKGKRPTESGRTANASGTGTATTVNSGIIHFLRKACAASTSFSNISRFVGSVETAWGSLDRPKSQSTAIDDTWGLGPSPASNSASSSASKTSNSFFNFFSVCSANDDLFSFNALVASSNSLTRDSVINPSAFTRYDPTLPSGSGAGGSRSSCPVMARPTGVGP